MFLNETSTKKTWNATIEDGCLTETCDENPQLYEGNCSAVGPFHGQNGIYLCMFHITLDHIRRRIPCINVHGDNTIAIINDTQMAMMVLIQTTFMNLAQIQYVHHADIYRCKDHMARPMVFRKQSLDFLTKSIKMMFDIVVFKDCFLLFMIHSSMKINLFYLKFIFYLSSH